MVEIYRLGAGEVARGCEISLQRIPETTRGDAVAFSEEEGEGDQRATREMEEAIESLRISL